MKATVYGVEVEYSNSAELQAKILEIRSKTVPRYIQKIQKKRGKKSTKSTVPETVVDETSNELDPNNLSDEDVVDTTETEDNKEESTDSNNVDEKDTELETVDDTPTETSEVQEPVKQESTPTTQKGKRK